MTGTETDDTVRMAELTWQEFEDRIDDGPAFVPIGSTEQHGPHLPLSVDTVIASEIAEQTAREAGGMVHRRYTTATSPSPEAAAGRSSPRRRAFTAILSAGKWAISSPTSRATGFASS